jgi:CTP:molybdopterin cytidylyltransferase MocA
MAQRLLASRARAIVAVLVNRAGEIDAALGRLPIERVRNPDFADGLSTSLKRGLGSLPADLAFAAIMRGRPCATLSAPLALRRRRGTIALRLPVEPRLPTMRDLA